MLRNDPSLDVGTRPWAAHAGTMFGRLAVARGVLVLNDPDGLSLAQNKLYFQSFPEVVRPATLISMSIDEIRAFIDDQPEGAVVKPLQGSGGKNVFKVDSTGDANLNQIVEAVAEEGYLIAQSYIPAATAGDVRLFMMNGVPLECDGKFAALRRVPTEGELRSNLHVQGKPAKALVTDDILAIADMVRPKLIQDGLFMVGLDIVGDKVLEINVFTPGGLYSICELQRTNFAEEVDHRARKEARDSGRLRQCDPEQGLSYTLSPANAPRFRRRSSAAGGRGKAVRRPGRSRGTLTGIAGSRAGRHRHPGRRRDQPQGDRRRAEYPRHAYAAWRALVCLDIGRARHAVLG